MPTADAIAAEEERLYESASLRDDLNDEDAQALLTWGQEQVRRLAQAYPDDFEQQARFLRQLLKSINRFVGQREFQDTREGEEQYMKKIMLWLPKLGWEDVTREQLYNALPDDKGAMTANLAAILRVLSPPETTTDDASATLTAGFGETGSDASVRDIESPAPSDAASDDNPFNDAPPAHNGSDDNPFNDAPPAHDGSDNNPFNDAPPAHDDETP